MTGDINATTGITLTSNLTIDGNGYSINGSRVSGDLFTADSYNVTLTDLTITGVGGHVITDGNTVRLISSDFDNNGGVWKMHGGSTLYMINCLIQNCKNTRAIDGWTNRANNVNYYIFNCIFRNNPKPTVIQWNQANFYGFNFYVEDQFVTTSTYTTYKGNLNQETDASISNYAFARQQTGDFEGYAKSSPVTITITAKDVFVNQSNLIKVRLNATIGDNNVGYYNVGVQNEEVSVLITFEDGTTENLKGTTDFNGFVNNITNYNGVIYNSITASKPGIVNITVTYAGSPLTSDDGQQLYLPNSAKGNYNVYGIPTNTTLNVTNNNTKEYNTTANKTSTNMPVLNANITDVLNITANVTLDNDTVIRFINETFGTTNITEAGFNFTDDEGNPITNINEILINSGNVTFYLNGTKIGNSTVKNGTASILYNVTKAGLRNITAVFEGTEMLNMSTSLNLTLKVPIMNVNISVPERYTDYIGNNVNITVNVTDIRGNNITEGKVRFNYGNTYEDVDVVNGTATFTSYVIKGVSPHEINISYLGTEKLQFNGK